MYEKGTKVISTIMYDFMTKCFHNLSLKYKFYVSLACFKGCLEKYEIKRKSTVENSPRYMRIYLKSYLVEYFPRWIIFHFGLFFANCYFSPVF